MQKGSFQVKSTPNCHGLMNNIKNRLPLLSLSNPVTAVSYFKYFLRNAAPLLNAVAAAAVAFGGGLTA